MRIIPIANYSVNGKIKSDNCSRQNYFSNSYFVNNKNSISHDTVSFTNATKKAQAVLDFVAKGCPISPESEKKFVTMFAPQIYDLRKFNTPVEDILKQCGDDLGLTKKALGNYGLELYAGLPAGSTIKNARKDIVETGFFSQFDDINTNLYHYLDYNPAGQKSEVGERLGIASELWLDKVDDIETGIFKYKTPIESDLPIKAATLRSNAIRNFLDKQ